MKIVIADTTLAGPLIGGAQTFLPSLLSGLAGREEKVHIVSNGELNGRIRQQYYDSGATLHTTLIPVPALVEDVTPALAEQINQINPDVYVISVSPDVGWTVLPLLNRKIATLAIAHTDDATFYRPVSHYRDYLTATIGVSREVCQQLINQGQMPDDRVVWIPYGVVGSEQPAVFETEAPLRMIYCARLEDTQKRASDVIEIIEKLRGSGIEFTLQVLGDGPLSAKFAERLAPEIAAGRVRLHGWVDSQSVLAQLRQAEVFLLTSAYEGLCIALLEAMANGLAPLITDIPSGNRQMVEHESNGLLASAGDVDGFVNYIRRLAQDRESLLRFRRAAWARAQDFTVERMIDNYLNCFRRAGELNRKHPRQTPQDFPLMESCRSNYPLWLRRLKLRAKHSMPGLIPG
jgi:glycosyltransferase involved in cell wall biosynthesis